MPESSMIFQKREIVDYAYKLLDSIAQMKTHDTESHANVITAIGNLIGEGHMSKTSEAPRRRRIGPLDVHRERCAG